MEKEVNKLTQKTGKELESMGVFQLNDILIDTSEESIVVRYRPDFKWYIDPYKIITVKNLKSNLIKSYQFNLKRREEFLFLEHNAGEFLFVDRWATHISHVQYCIDELMLSLDKLTGKETIKQVCDKIRNSLIQTEDDFISYCFSVNDKKQKCINAESYVEHNKKESIERSQDTVRKG